MTYDLFDLIFLGIATIAMGIAALQAILLTILYFKSKK